jgi:UDP-glucose 4-epimerase
VFGSDYDTPDGTCIRDFVHVSDLARAHVLALEALLMGRKLATFNLGNGRGFSVREVLTAARGVTGRDIPYRIGPRRAGDPARLVADARRARAELGWEPRLSALDSILSTAWAWHMRHSAPSREEQTSFDREISQALAGVRGRSSGRRLAG